MKRKFMTMGLVVMALMLMALSVGAASSVELIGADFGADVIAAGNFKPSLTLQNNGEAISDATLITVVYEGKRLKDVSYEGNVAIANGNVTIDASKEVSVTDAENSEIKVMLWKGFEPLITAQTLNDKSRSLKFKFNVNGEACDINTKSNIIYVITADGNAVSATAQTEGANASVLNAAAEGMISAGDTYTVSAQNETVPTKTFTVAVEKAASYNYVTTFDNGMNGKNPYINSSSDSGRFDCSFYGETIDDNGNNVYLLDGTSEETSCNVHRYWYADPKDKYQVDFKFNLKESNGHYLFYIDIFNTKTTGVSNKFARFSISTWDNSTSPEYVDYYVKPGTVQLAHTNFNVPNRFALVPTDSWHTFKAVLRKATETTTSVEYYVDEEFCYSEVIDFALSSKVASQQDRYLFIQDAEPNRSTFKLLLDDMAFRW